MDTPRTHPARGPRILCLLTALAAGIVAGLDLFDLARPRAGTLPSFRDLTLVDLLCALGLAGVGLVGALVPGGGAAARLGGLAAALLAAAAVTLVVGLAGPGLLLPTGLLGLVLLVPVGILAVVAAARSARAA